MVLTKDSLRDRIANDVESGKILINPINFGINHNLFL